jgi:hypothetical protein
MALGIHFPCWSHKTVADRILGMQVARGELGWVPMVATRELTSTPLSQSDYRSRRFVILFTKSGPGQES